MDPGNPSRRHLSESAILSGARIGLSTAISVGVLPRLNFGFPIIGAPTYG